MHKNFDVTTDAFRSAILALYISTSFGALTRTNFAPPIVGAILGLAILFMLSWHVGRLNTLGAKFLVAAPALLPQFLKLDLVALVPAVLLFVCLAFFDHPSVHPYPHRVHKRARLGGTQ